MARRSKFQELIYSIKETGEIPEVLLAVSKISGFPIQEWTKEDLFCELDRIYGRVGYLLLDNWLPYYKTKLPRPQIHVRITVHYLADSTPYAAEAEEDTGKRGRIRYFEIKKNRARRVLLKTFMRLMKFKSSKS